MAGSMAKQGGGRRAGAAEGGCAVVASAGAELIVDHGMLDVAEGSG